MAEPNLTGNRSLERPLGQTNIEVQTKIREESPLVASFPWNSRAPLTKGPLNVQFRLPLRRFLFPLALKIDKCFHNLQISHDMASSEIKRIFNPDSERSTSFSRETIIKVTPLLTAMRVLDTYMNLHSTDDERPFVLKHSKTQMEKKPKSQIWSKFSQWSQILLECRSTLVAMVNLKDPAVENWRDMNHFQVLMMASSQVHAADAGLHCLRNVLHAAMGIAVLNGCEDDNMDGSIPSVPDNASDFAQLVTEYAQRDTRFQAGHFQSISGTSLLARDGKGSRDAPRHMNTPITLAAMVSPVALFFPLQLVTNYLSKSDPAMWAKTIGNCKPQLLQDVEREIWMALFDIASGQKTPLCALLDCFDRLDWNAIETADCSNWFAEGFDDETCPRLRNFNDFHLASEVPHNWTCAQSFLDEVAKRASALADLAQQRQIEHESLHTLTTAPPSPNGTEQSTSGAQNNPEAELADQQTMANNGGVATNNNDTNTGNPDNTTAKSSLDHGTTQNGANEGDLNENQRLSPVSNAPIPHNTPPPLDSQRSAANTDSDNSQSRRSTTPVVIHPAPTNVESESEVPPPRPGKRGRDAKLGKAKDSRSRSVTVKRSSSYARDVPAPMEVVEFQALHKKIEFIDIDKITSGRPSTNADVCKTAKKLQNKNDPSFIVYNPRGKEVVITPELHYQEQLDNLFALVAASKVGRYTDGKPNFITSKDNSIFQIMTEAESKAYDQEKLLDLLRTKVLIITESDTEFTTFDESGLSDLKDLSSVISVHDYSVRGKKGDFGKRNKKTTLEAILKCSRKPTGKILNALDIPMGWKGAPPTIFSSETRAWNATEGLPYCKEDILPANALRWALVTTKGAHSPWHIDANGSAAFLVNGCGAKLIFVGYLPDGSRFNRIDLFLNNFDQYATCSERWKTEAIYLGPGDKIVLPPNTPHSVYTSENTICHGGHLFVSTTMTDTLVGIIHNFFCNSISTNTDHVEWRDLIHRMNVFYHDTLVTGSPVKDPRTKPHAPRLTDLVSLLNVFSTCALAILMNALSIETYHPPEEGEDTDNNETNSWHEMYDLNAMNGFTRAKCIHHRALAWEIIHHIDARYTFKNKDTDEPLSAFDDIFVPFISHLARASINLGAEVAKLDFFPSLAKLSGDAFENQVRACFHHHDVILNAIDKHKKVDTLIYPFGFDCIISPAVEFDSDDVVVKTSGETSRDVLYESGRESSWKLYEAEDASGDDEDMNTDSQDDEDYIPSAKRAKLN